MNKRPNPIVSGERPVIVVNASALRTSGALTILKQFVGAVPQDGYTYLVFVDSSVGALSEQSNIRFVEVDKRSACRRLYWDWIGLKRWLVGHGIVPVASISLQNTNFRTGFDHPDFMYYHQSIPFFHRMCNPLKSGQRTLWFYKNVYPFFVRFSLKRDTDIFLQTESMKRAFAKTFSFPLQRIHPVAPAVTDVRSAPVVPVETDPGRIVLCYPAAAFIYKNHGTIRQALDLLPVGWKERISLYLTCEAEELGSNRPEEKDGMRVHFMGAVPFDRVLTRYRQADLMLFPSYIESFGLPLIEAASFGIPIIAADLAYAREALEGYGNVRFACYDDPAAWARQIEQVFSTGCNRSEPLASRERKSWPELFGIVGARIAEKNPDGRL